MQNTKPAPLVIYHTNCIDGLGAAAVMSAYFDYLGQTAQYVALQYEMELQEDVTGRDVYIVDFSFPPEQMEQIEKRAASLIVLDHHASFRDNLNAGKECKRAQYSCTHCNGFLRFDDNKSGTMMAWEFVFNAMWASIRYRTNLIENPLLSIDLGTVATSTLALKIRNSVYNPYGDFNNRILSSGITDLATRLIDSFDFCRAISDRDRFAFKVEGSKAVHAFMTTIEPTVEAFKKVIFCDNYGRAIMIGRSVLMLRDKQAADVALAAKPLNFCGYSGVYAFSYGQGFNSEFSSDVALKLYTEKSDCDFVLFYKVTPKGINVSLRAPERLGSDLREVAKKYNAQGHEKACAFQIPLEQLVPLLAGQL